MLTQGILLELDQQFVRVSGDCHCLPDQGSPHHRILLVRVSMQLQGQARQLRYPLLLDECLLQGCASEAFQQRKLGNLVASPEYR